MYREAFPDLELRVTTGEDVSNVCEGECVRLLGKSRGEESGGWRVE